MDEISLLAVVVHSTDYAGVKQSHSHLTVHIRKNIMGKHFTGVVKAFSRKNRSTIAT